MHQASRTHLLAAAGALALTVAAVGAAAPDRAWSAAGEICHTVMDSRGEPVLAQAGMPVLTVASEPCPVPEPVVAAVEPPPPPAPEPAPAAGPIFTIGGDVAFDSARIRTEFYPTLDEIATALNANPGQRVVLTGHTDSLGSERYNEVLSLRRAQAAADYLRQAGVAPDRIGVAGAGEGRPVASNDTEGGRAQNRRVEITEA